MVVGTRGSEPPPSDNSSGYVAPGQDFSVARLNLVILDSSFGSGGRLLIGFNIGDNNDTANGVALSLT